MYSYFPGMLVGFILLQTAIVAPTLMKTLNRERFGTVIRALWPRFFLCLAVLGVGSLGTLLVLGEGSLAQYVIAGATVGCALVCYAIIPATNRATDTGNHARFQLLHRISVGMTVLMLLGNIGAAFL